MNKTKHSINLERPCHHTENEEGAINLSILTVCAWCRHTRGRVECTVATKNDYWNSFSGFRLGIYNFQLPRTGFRSGGISFSITGYRLPVVRRRCGGRGRGVEGVLFQAVSSSQAGSPSGIPLQDSSRDSRPVLKVVIFVATVLEPRLATSFMDVSKPLCF